MEIVRIIFLTVAAAIAYGIAHDQVTARICVEYFTIGHPPLFPTTSPTLLALGWGIVATWWVGLPLGVLLAIAARVGTRPRHTAASLRRPLAILLVAMGLSALLAGLVGGVLAARGAVWLVQPLNELVPRTRHVPFLVDMWAHSASYLVGIGGGLALATWTWQSRSNMNRVSAT